MDDLASALSYTRRLSFGSSKCSKVVRIEDLHALIELARSVMLDNHFDNPLRADGNCGYATDLFCNLAAYLLPEVQDEDVSFDGPDLYASARSALKAGSNLGTSFAYEEAPHDWYLGGCSWPGHVVAKLGPYCIDWTARQFKPGAPFPLIFECPA